MMSYPDFKYKQIAVHIAGGSRERLRFRADNILIEDENGKVIFQHSCHRLFALFIIGEMSLTSAAIKHAVAFAFPVILMNHNLKVYAKINCGAEGNTLLRAKQYASGDRNLFIAKMLIRQKIDNQIALIKNVRHLAADDKQAVHFLNTFDLEKAENIHEIMGVEGNASRIFFATYFRTMDWKRREPRCKRDIYNLLLDIGYTYLFHFVEAMLTLYGFDLYCGVLHSFFYQRKSLVCDIVEPFRCIIDQRLRKAYNLGQIHTDDFFVQDMQYHLQWKQQAAYTKLFMKDILENKEAIFKFCQKYYRWFIKDADLAEFPVFKIK